MARINGYHSGKSGYNHAYDYKDGLFVRIGLDDVDELLYGAEFEFEFDEDELDNDRNEADGEEYIQVYSADYGEYMEMENPYYDPDYGEGSLDSIADNLPNMPTYRLEHDGSLNCGFELITMPMTRRALIAFTKQDWFVRLVNMSLGDNDTNGLHIHVSKRGIVYRSRLMYQWKAVENYIQSAYRYSNDYCSFPWGSAENFYMSNRKSYNRQERYDCINFNNEKTIEFRIFNMVGSDMDEHIEMCLDTIDSTIENASKYTLDELYQREITFEDCKIVVGDEIVREVPARDEEDEEQLTVSSAGVTLRTSRIDGEATISSTPRPQVPITDRTVFFTGNRVRVNVNLLRFYWNNYEELHRPENREMLEIIDPTRLNMTESMINDILDYGHGYIYEIGSVYEHRNAVDLRNNVGRDIGYYFHPRWLIGVE